MRISAARLDYAADGTPCSTHFNDVYHATDGGLDQARHVFIAGNTLPARWQQRDSFTILETGFGLGLNFLATWQAWRNDPQRCTRLHFISTELHPFNAADLRTLHQRWPELAEFTAELQANWPPLTPGFHQLLLDSGRVTLTLLLGDATHTLPELQGQADAIFLDGFAPQKNPQLWSADVLALLTQHAAPGATLASWCVMGEVRQTLSELGWQIKKKPGYGRKWQMLSGTWSDDAAAQAAPEKTALVIGAGIAGCSMAEALVRRDWQVALIDRHAAAAQEASGNPAGLLHPMLSRDDNLATRFSRAGYLYALRLLQRLQQAGYAINMQACGIVELADEPMLTDFPADYVQPVTQQQASDLAGMPVASGGYWFPHGVALQPASLCATLLAEATKAATPLLTTHWNSSVARIAYLDGHWHAYAADGRCIARAAVLVLANADDAKRLLPDIEMTLRPIRGQITLLPGAALQGLRTALCGSSYVTPPLNGLACLGASFVEDDADTAVRDSEHAENLQHLQQLLPSLNMPADVTSLAGRVAFRTATHDRLPLVGALPASSFRPSLSLPRLPRQAGLHALLGLGSRGLIWAPLGAELLAAQIAGAALPVEQALSKALDPARFHLKKLRRLA